MTQNLSKLLTCGHCGNISRMAIIGNVIDDLSNQGNNDETQLDSSNNYSILKCPGCNDINVVYYYWSDHMDDEDDVRYTVLYPIDKDIPVGLPSTILSGFLAAEKVRTIEINAYVFLLRRLLELVCLDKGATGGTLAAMLENLANRGEIPEKLVLVAKGLRLFGNIGAHAGVAELTKDEVPIVRDLTIALLEYVYSAPYLATLADEKLKVIKAKK